MNKRIPNGTRAIIHIKRLEGESMNRIGQIVGVSKGSIINVLRENTDDYQYEIDRITKESLANWQKIREMSQGLLLRLLEAVRAAPPSAEVSLRELCTIMDIAQKNETLLYNEIMLHNKTQENYRRLREMPPAERHARIKRLLEISQKIYPKALIEREE
ncbi:MAG: hypothetical protein KAT56_05025 [Sedimentisphaerales bacterium]|nr:hypothetical protein [Sedimentisphaerales bacterium]